MQLYWFIVNLFNYNSIIREESYVVLSNTGQNVVVCVRMYAVILVFISKSITNTM